MRLLKITAALLCLMPGAALAEDAFPPPRVGTVAGTYAAGNDGRIPNSKRDDASLDRLFQNDDGTVNLRLIDIGQAVNHVGLQPGRTKNGPAIVAVGSDTSIDLNASAKGQGGIYLGNYSGLGFAVLDPATGNGLVDYISVSGGDGTTSPKLASTANLDYNVNSTFSHNFKINGQTGFSVVDPKTGSAIINALSVSGGDGTVNPKILSPTNIEYNVPSNFTQFFKVNGKTQFGVSFNQSSDTSYVNASAGGQNGVLNVTSSLANAGFYLQSKGPLGSLTVLNGQGSGFKVQPTTATKNGATIRPSDAGVAVLFYSENTAYDGTGDAYPTLRLSSGQSRANSTGRVEIERLDIRDVLTINGFERYVPTTGFSKTIASLSAGASGLKMVPAGTLSSGTIIMPASPVDNQVVRIVSSQTITTLTVQGNTGQSIVGAPTSISSTSPIAFIYDTATTTWIRM